MPDAPRPKGMGRKCIVLGADLMRKLRHRYNQGGGRRSTVISDTDACVFAGVGYNAYLFRAVLVLSGPTPELRR